MEDVTVIMVLRYYYRIIINNNNSESKQTSFNKYSYENILSEKLYIITFLLNY